MIHDQVKYGCRVLFAELTEDVKYILTTDHNHTANHSLSLDYNRVNEQLTSEQVLNGATFSAIFSRNINGYRQ